MIESCITPAGLYQIYSESSEISRRCEVLLTYPVTPSPFHFWDYLKAFSETCLLELPFYFWATRKFALLKRFQILILANLATHPAVYFLFPFLFSLWKGRECDFLTVAETFAPLVEAILLWKIWRIRARVAFPVMILANLFSWKAGVVIQSYI